MQSAIDGTDPFDGVKTADFDEGVASGLIRYISDKCLDDFLDAVQGLSLSGGAEDLSVVYTPAERLRARVREQNTLPHRR